MLLPNGYVDYEAHVQNIGKLVEDMETSIRNTIENIYVTKSKEIIGTARYDPNMNKPNIPHIDEVKKAFIGRQNN